MATLKFRTAHGYGWVCDVKAVEIGAYWDVPAARFSEPEAARTGRSVFGVFNTISHELPSGEHERPPLRDGEQYDDRKSWPAVEVLVRRQHGSGYDDDRHEVHIVPAGECWLMGDDGRTIDRIP